LKNKKCLNGLKVYLIKKLVLLPENIDIPRGIPESRVKIHSMYAGGDLNTMMLMEML